MAHIQEILRIVLPLPPGAPVEPYPSQPLVSQHLRVLRGQQLVISTVHGQFHTYQLSDEHVSHIVGDAIEHAKESL